VEPEPRLLVASSLTGLLVFRNGTPKALANLTSSLGASPDPSELPFPSSTHKKTVVKKKKIYIYIYIYIYKIYIYKKYILYI
jgi:hypothetical protein